ncbi:MAG TPA: sigma-70 family RNA polymerase sigma factor [Gemmatimonadaceae bacterium]|nr:sigma-70 family RNA polymerase sigma factor [Gemmatimonadaceae bacterium]
MNTKLFEALMMPLLGDVARFARSLARDPVRADDLVQETYFQALRGWHTFHSGSDPKRWLLAVCHNAYMRMLRRESRYVEAPEHDPELSSLATARAHYEAERSGIVGILDRMDLKAALDDALHTLPPSSLAVITLIDVDARSYEEAAAILAVPIGTVRSRLFRARRVLQDQLFEYARDAGIRTPNTGPGHASRVRQPSEQKTGTATRRSFTDSRAPTLIDCETTVRRLWDYIDNRSSRLDREEVDAHLQTCSLCARRFAFARAMKDALGQLNSAEALALPDGESRVSLRARVRAALERVNVDLAPENQSANVLVRHRHRRSRWRASG